MSVYWQSARPGPGRWCSDVPAEQQVLEREFEGDLTNSGYDRDMLQAIVDRALETEALETPFVVHDNVGRSSLRPGDVINIGGDRARVVSIEGTTLTVERDSQLRGRHYETVAVDECPDTFLNDVPLERIEDRHISELNRLKQKLNSLPKGKTYQRKEIEKQIRRYETKSDREKLRIAEAQISKLEKHISDLQATHRARLNTLGMRLFRAQEETRGLHACIRSLHDEITDQCSTDNIESVVKILLENIRQLKNPPQRVSDKPRRIKLNGETQND